MVKIVFVAFVPTIVHSALLQLMQLITNANLGITIKKDTSPPVVLRSCKCGKKKCIVFVIFKYHCCNFYDSILRLLSNS